MSSSVLLLLRFLCFFRAWQDGVRFFSTPGLFRLGGDLRGAGSTSQRLALYTLLLAGGAVEGESARSALSTSGGHVAPSNGRDCSPRSRDALTRRRRDSIPPAWPRGRAGMQNERRLADVALGGTWRAYRLPIGRVVRQRAALPLASCGKRHCQSPGCAPPLAPHCGPLRDQNPTPPRQ